MTVLIPSAGFGKRFSDKGFVDPKPFVKINDKYIIEYALSSFKIKGKYYVITSKLDQKYLSILDDIYKKYDIDGETVNLDRPTSGATDTCLSIEDRIDPTKPLIVTLNDQYTPWNHEKFLRFAIDGDYDVVVTTYNHPNIVVGKQSPYSFIKVDSNRLATEFAEKIAISEHALNGIHYWKTADLFFTSAKKLMKSDINFNGEKYLSLTFRFLIEDNKKITYYKMDDNEFVSLGSPSEVENNRNKL